MTSEADEIAGSIHQTLLYHLIGPTAPVVAALARDAVLRWFGCTCRGHCDDGAVYVEDVTCPVHGQVDLPAGHLTEPQDRSYVLGRHRDHHAAGHVWHRDDREGHGDPLPVPQCWWSHDEHRWMSWPEIERYAAAHNMTLVTLGRPV